MGVLAIDAMSIEGQVEKAAITRAASNSAPGVDFATELDSKLQYGNKPTPNSAQAALQNEAPQKLDSDAGLLTKAVSDSWKAVTPEDRASMSALPQANSTAEPSRAFASVVTRKDESVSMTAPAPMSETVKALQATRASNLGNESQAAGPETPAPLNHETARAKQQGPSSDPEAPARQTAESGLEFQPCADAAVGPNAQISTPGQPSLDLFQPAPFEFTKAVPTSSKTVTSRDKDSTPALIQASPTFRPPHAVASVTAGKDEAVPISTPSQPSPDSSQPAPLEVPKVASTSSKTVTPQGKDSRPALIQASPTFQPSRAVASVTAVKDECVPISTPSQPSQGISQPAPFEVVKAASTSSKAVADQGSASPPALPQASSTLQSTRAVASVIAVKDECVPISTPSQPSQGISQPAPFEVAKAASTSSKAVADQGSTSTPAFPQSSSTLEATRAFASVTMGKDESVPISTPSPTSLDLSQPVPFEFMKTGLTSSKIVTAQDKDSTPILPQANSPVEPSRAFASVIAGKGESVPVMATAPVWDGVPALHATRVSSIVNESQAAGPETPGPLNHEMAQAKQQSPSSGPQAPARQAAESISESQSRPDAAIGPNAQISTPGLSPDFSLSTSFELNEAVASGPVDEPQNSDRTKNAQEVTGNASGANLAADPGATMAARLVQADNTDGVATGSLVGDAQQVSASAPAQGGKAAPDVTKVGNEKAGLSKAEADPSLAQPPIPQGRAEAGSAFTEPAGVSRSRGQAGSAAISDGSQVNATGVVSSARFIQQAGNAEMQVRLRSEALGPIDVHTIAKGSDIGASIRVEARDTQVLLANELSQLEQALNQRNLRVERLDVLQGSVSGGQSDGTAPGNYHGNPSQPRQSSSSYSSSQTYTSLPEAPTVSEDWGLGPSSTRINLRV